MTMKDVLDRLPSVDRKKLQYAFENELQQHVALEGNKFIGVNCEKVTILKIEERIGVWSRGTILGEYK